MGVKLIEAQLAVAERCSAVVPYLSPEVLADPVSRLCLDILRNRAKAYNGGGAALYVITPNRNLLAALPESPELVEHLCPELPSSPDGVKMLANEFVAMIEEAYTIQVTLRFSLSLSL